MNIRMVQELDECARLWERLGPAKTFFDLWDVRMCFQQSFQRPPCFVVAQLAETIVGLLPLSYVEENNQYVFFPGETWHGKTWLEDNRFYFRDLDVLGEMFDFVNLPINMRYIDADRVLDLLEWICEDEIGYLFYPGRYEYSFANYVGDFRRKAFKGIARDVQRLMERKVEYRYNVPADREIMFRMNLDGFGENSYFHDPRFLVAFEKLAQKFEANDNLITTTVLIDGSIAAVDLGAVWNNTYTVLAGGVNPEFPGVAKLINFHHLEMACQKRFDRVDFLCGDFGWKNRFRLQPRSLYLLNTPILSAFSQVS